MCRGRFHHGIFQIPFHSIPFQVFPVELEWNFPFVCTYVLRKLYLSTYYHVHKIVINLFSEPGRISWGRKELYYSYVEMCDWFPPIRFQFQWNIPDSTYCGTEKFHSTFSPWNGNGTDLYWCVIFLANLCTLVRSVSSFFLFFLVRYTLPSKILVHFLRPDKSIKTSISPTSKHGAHISRLWRCAPSIDIGCLWVQIFWNEDTKIGHFSYGWIDFLPLR